MSTRITKNRAGHGSRGITIYNSRVLRDYMWTLLKQHTTGWKPKNKGYLCKTNYQCLIFVINVIWWQYIKILIDHCLKMSLGIFLVRDDSLVQVKY